MRATQAAALAARALEGAGVEVWLCTPDMVMAVHESVACALVGLLDALEAAERFHGVGCVGFGTVFGGPTLGVYGPEVAWARRLACLGVDRACLTEAARQGLTEVPAGVGLHRARGDLERLLGAPFYAVGDYRR